MPKEDTHPSPGHLHATESSKGGALPDKDQAALPRQLRAEPRSLNDCTACCKQASQVSMQPGISPDQAY